MIIAGNSHIRIARFKFFGSFLASKGDDNYKEMNLKRTLIVKQKLRAAVDYGNSDAERLSAISAVFGDSETERARYKKYETAAARVWAEMGWKESK
jgi:hypothetical protein